LAGWVDTGFLNASGKRLEYACHGPAPDKAPTLVMLHEGLGCVALWRDVPARLAVTTGMGVVAFSRAGYGQSDPADLPRPLDYMTREAVEVLPEVLDAIGFRSGVLLGHSDGATIAAIHCGHFDDARVRGLVLIAPHFFAEAMGLAEIEQARMAYVTTELRGKMAKYHRDPDNAFFGWNDSWLHRDFKDWNVAGFIDTIRVPVLVVQGEKDQYGTLAQIRELETRCPMPVKTVIPPGAHHAPHLEATEQTLNPIIDFCLGLNLFAGHSVETEN
jgi:pimeloyl-ACP methyl ester carboxylesterase